MKKIMIMFLILNSYFMFSSDIIKIKDIRTKIASMQNGGIDAYMKEIANKKVEKETGLIVSIKLYDATNDIVTVELDKPDIKNLVPDLSFVIDKKISKRLSEMQMLYFNGTITDYDEDKKMLEIAGVFLSGIM